MVTWRSVEYGSQGTEAFRAKSNPVMSKKRAYLVINIKGKLARKGTSLDFQRELLDTCSENSGEGGNTGRCFYRFRRESVSYGNRLG